MKKYLFLIGFLLQLTLATAQNGKYIPFPSNMIVYKYESRSANQIEAHTSSRFEILGDTLINGLQYSKYYLASTNGGVAPYGIKKRTKLEGAVRNDTLLKKVYLYSFINNTEELLYDFDLQVGDTLFKNNGFKFYHSLFEDHSNAIIDTARVSRIDSILMPHDNLYHKRFHFTAKLRRFINNQGIPITSDTVSGNFGVLYKIKINPLIEGVGFEHDAITFLSEFEWQYVSALYCNSIDNKTLYKYPYIPIPFGGDLAYCNSILTGIDDKEDNASTLKLYPNPSNGKFNLETTETDINFFEISNLFGVKILSSKVESYKMEIDLSSQPSGVYFIRAVFRNGTSVTKKLMIQ